MSTAFEPFRTLTSRLIPLDRANVDTDAILPKQFMKSIARSGFGPHLFDEWRYLDPGEPGMAEDRRRPNPTFVLNQPKHAGARILLARENFGCGSSREHAVWALRDYGIRALVAPSFSDIFRGNCFRNGLLPVELPAELVESIFASVFNDPGFTLAVSLETQTVRDSDGAEWSFEIDPVRRHRLIEGLDDIGLTLQQADSIRAFEQRRRDEEPWVFGP